MSECEAGGYFWCFVSTAFTWGSFFICMKERERERGRKKRKEEHGVARFNSGLFSSALPLPVPFFFLGGGGGGGGGREKFFGGGGVVGV